MLVDCYTKKHKQIQEAIEAENSTLQRKMNMYKSELQALKDNCESDAAILESFQNIYLQRRQLLSEINQNTISGSLQVNSKEPTKPETKSSSELQGETDSDSNVVSNNGEKITGEEASEEDTAVDKGAVGDNGTENNIHKKQLLFDIAMYQRLLEASHIEKKHLINISQLQEKQMYELSNQVAEAGKLIAAREIERSNLLEKIMRMQRTLTKRDKASLLKDELEGLRFKIEAHKEENNFLRNFLLSAINKRTEDFDLYKKYLHETKQFFSATFQDVVRSFSESKSADSLMDINVDCDK